MRHKSRFFFFFFNGYPAAPATLPPLNFFCTFAKNQLGIHLWAYFWVLYSAALISVSISPSIPHSKDSDNTNIRFLVLVLQISEAVLIFFQSLFSSFSTLGNFYRSVIKFTDSFVFSHHSAVEPIH